MTEGLAAAAVRGVVALAERRQPVGRGGADDRADVGEAAAADTGSADFRHQVGEVLAYR